MAGNITILNSKYFRPFDNTDNPGCWQVARLSDDVDDILESCQIEYEAMADDWGASYSWWSEDGMEHCMTLSCIDTDTVTFEIEFWAIMKRWLGLRKEVLENTPDFNKMIPKLRELNEEAQQAAT